MAQYPFQNPDLPIAERVADLLSRLTLEEKVGQMIDDSKPIERLGIPSYHWWNEALHGVGRFGRATVFPQAITLAATWNPSLVERVAEAISDEARAKHHAAVRQGNRQIYTGLTYWSPNINIFRDPRWGRGQETYGEDPVLTAEMGKAFVRGLQGDDPRYLKLVATPKHFAVHSGPEVGRAAFDVHPSAKDLWETYLPAFEACVREAGAASVMGAYNRLYGHPCNASRFLLTEVLREKWGFQGYVVSDCWAIENIVKHHKTASSMAEAAAQSVKAGCDLSCGGAFSALKDAVEQGLIAEEEVDRALARLLEARFRLGMFDPEERVPYAGIPESVVDSPEHRALARRAAREAIVLLKNEASLLPLPKTLKKIVVTGPTADRLDVLWGNYHGYGSPMVSLLEGIVGKVSIGTKVNHAPGCALFGPAAEDPLKGIAWELTDADVIVACMGLSPAMEGEEGDLMLAATSGDRPQLELPECQRAFLKALPSQGIPIVLVLTGGSPIAVAEELEGVQAAVLVGYPGCEGGNAVADVLFGDANPSGRLPFTVPASTDDLPPFEDYSMVGRTYRYFAKKPLFPFGYGLSYSAFRYSNLRVEPGEVAPGAGVALTVDVTNEGTMDGAEVVQAYVRDVEASVRVPRHSLAAFQRVEIPAGGTVTVRLELPARRFELVDEQGQRRLEPGEFHVFVGGGQPFDEDVQAGRVLRTSVTAR
ncbi:MAG: glycoside hydrolase family 3 C-terminal domain-containing protein [Fimbriimonadales bacterium]|nr:glycoside hydrolase family 3 C-terminal domain-containing protein [Fimbriimonadales bacterium]